MAFMKFMAYVPRKHPLVSYMGIGRGPGGLAPNILEKQNNGPLMFSRRQEIYEVHVGGSECPPSPSTSPAYPYGVKVLLRKQMGFANSLFQLARERNSEFLISESNKIHSPFPKIESFSKYF